MHKLFADWLRPANPNATSEELEARWKAVEALSKKISAERALELVQIAHGLPDPSRQAEKKIRDVLKAADTTFGMRDNDLELRILAGSAIAFILEQTPRNETDVLALAELAFAFKNQDGNLLVPESLSNAKAYVAKESHRVRKRDTSIKIPTPNFSPLDVSLPSNTPWQSVGPSLTTVLEKIRDELNSFGTEVKNTFEALLREMEARDEEANILWWLFAEHSRSLDQSFSKVGQTAASLVLASELSDLTVISPGPISSQAILRRALKATCSDGKPLTVKSAINGTPRSFRSRFSLSNVPGALCVLHEGIGLSLRSNSDDDWVSMFKGSTGIDPDQPREAADIAHQFYTEIMLLRAISLC